MAGDKKDLFSERISAGSRTYFFDVNVSSEGTKYLKISEVRNAEGESHNRVMVFQENIENFMEALHKAVSVMTSGTASKPGQK